MTSNHPSELDSGMGDSIALSPRSDHLPPPPNKFYDDLQPRVRFMCSFGGRILPRPHDNQLRYVGGETRMVAVHRATNFSALLTKLSKLSSTTTNTIDFTVKYQLPNEDLDALVSVTTDEDVENMIEEYDRLTHSTNSKTARLRLFLFPVDTGSNASSLSSLLEGKREHWFFDALNGSTGGGSGFLERGRSEVSSIVSEVPDYLFGLDSSEEARDPKTKNRSIVAENVSVSDPGSPVPITSTPFSSSSLASCMPSIPDLRPVKTRPEVNQIEGYEATVVEQSIPQQVRYPSNPLWKYMPGPHIPGPTVQHVQPVYYVQGPGQTSDVQVQPVPMPGPYIHQFPQPPGLQHMVRGVGQVYGEVVKPVMAAEAYEYAAGINSEAANAQVYYRMSNSGMTPVYPPSVVPVRAELQRTGSETKSGRVS